MPESPPEWELAYREIINTSPRTLTDDLIAQMFGWAQDSWMIDLGPLHPVTRLLTELAVERERVLREARRVIV